MLVKLHTSEDPLLQTPRGAVAAIAGGMVAGGQQQQRTIPPLGALGEFLLGRWREDDVRERVLMAQAGSVLQSPPS